MNPERYALLNPRTVVVDNLFLDKKSKKWAKPQKDTGRRQPPTHVNDLNAAFYGANPAGVEIIYRNAGLPTKGTQAFVGVFKEIQALAHRFNWNVRAEGTQQLQKLLKLAIFEINHSIKCYTCHGTPERVLPGQLKPTLCPTCKGRGIARIEDQERAKYLGMSKQAYSKKWKHHYRDIQILLETKEYNASKKATRNYG